MPLISLGNKTQTTAATGNTTTTVSGPNVSSLNPNSSVQKMISPDGVKVVSSGFMGTNQVNNQAFDNTLTSNFDKKLSNVGDISDNSKEDEPLNNTNVLSSPQSRPISLNLNDILNIALQSDASDIHLTVNYRAIIRVNGKLITLNSPILSPVQTFQYVTELIKDRKDVNINNINETDLTYKYGDRRFRVNIFKQMTTFSIVMRIIPDRILTVEELGLPQTVKNFSKYQNGLILVTGPTGSGKSTTIASLLNLINITEAKHIVTLEDPIEYVFPKGSSLIDQRELKIDFSTWDDALRAVLRQDPDVVLIGEMRDLETIEAALQISETGHLVFATLHTNDAASTIDRIIDVFDSAKQSQIRIQLSEVLRAVLSQKLVILPRGDRKVISEILIANPSIKNAIREQKTFQINNIIQTSSAEGMITMEKALVELVHKGLISDDYAKSISNHPDEMDILLNRS